VPLLVVISALSFVLLALTPGDQAREILGPTASPILVAQLRHSLGLDTPVYQQYWRWLDNAMHGNLGMSLFTGDQVTYIIRQRLPTTLSLVVASLMVMILFGVTIGAFSAIRGGWAALAVDAFAVIGFAVPTFWIGPVLIELLAVKLGWVPATGYVPLTESPVDWLRSLLLPVATLSLGGVAVVAKNTREAMLDVLASEHVRLAVANGLNRSVLLIYILRNTAIRIVTIFALMAVSLLGGTVIVEQIFALPGLGSALVNATLEHDLPIVQGIAVYFTMAIVLINLATDLLYRVLDPRVQPR
jgi:peptide/nickel transport system permease protein